MNGPDATSTRPYLIRALYEWCTDNGFTPYVAVAVDETVQVPREYVKNNEIVLNVGFDATSSLKLGNDFIEFKARFAGTSRDIMVPISRVMAIYARENGQGMAFPMGEPSLRESSPSTVATLSIVGSSAPRGAAALPPPSPGVGSSPSTATSSAQSIAPGLVTPAATEPTLELPDSRVVQLVAADDPKPPKPPGSPRPALKRVK